MAAENWTLQQILDQLNTGKMWANTQITYSFPTTSSSMYTGGGEGPGFMAFSGNQITMAEFALTGWDDLMAADFVRGTGLTSLEFGYSTSMDDFAHAYYPSVGSAWFNANQNVLFNPTLGKYGYETFLHEIGHALGLDHMGDYDASDPQSVHPYSYQDSTVLSVMSYFGPSHNDGEGEVMWADWVKGGISYSVQTPMVNDVMAIQAMYGAETTTRTGDTVYGFNSTLMGASANFYNFEINANPILTIYDSAGIDTLDLSGYATQCTISLVGGSYSDCNEMTYNIGIAYSAVIENAVGGSADDTLTGNAIANMLTGGRGDDTIIGGGGNDIAVFSGDYSDYTVTSNGKGSYTVTDNVGNDGSDTLTSIELLRFRDRDVTEGGEEDTAPVLVKAIVDQSTDADAPFRFTIPAGSFTDPNGDVLTYSAELKNGGHLPEWLIFDGRTGTFSGTPDAGDVGTISVVVVATDGNESATDSFDIVINKTTSDQGEDISGTFGNDTIVGTTASERIFGLLGKDDIFAGDGDDVIYGGSGSDFMWGEAGADTFAFDFARESIYKTNKFDVIMDFNGAEGDMIDLSSLDANLVRFGNQTFVFDGNGDGRAARGQIDHLQSNGDTHLFGYTDRDKYPDFYLRLDGIVEIDESNFIL